MLRRFSSRFMVLIFSADIGLTLIALWLAKYLRQILPFGTEVQPIYLEFEPVVYVLVALMYC